MPSATTSQAPPVHESSANIPLSGRVVALDAFRGFTMIWMISEGFGLAALRNHPNHPWLGAFAAQFDHAAWHGMTAWDLIQAFFMFIVGAAMPFSFAKRWAAGETTAANLKHVLKRCALLIFWGLVARSIQANHPVFDITNVLAQLAFTYFVAFLVLRKGWVTQGLTAIAILVADWALYRFVTAPGILGPWVKDANFGYWLDGIVLGKHWSGSWVTINCLPSAADTIFGVMAGWLLKSALPHGKKLRILVACGTASLIAGLALDPVIPIIKRIWTPSYQIYSLGFTLLVLAALYWICEVKQWRKWCSIAVIVGSNSIFIYLFHEILGRWLENTARVFMGWSIHWWGPWGEVLTACVVIAFQVWVCVWLYQRKIFFKL